LFFRGGDGLQAPDVVVLAIAPDSARDVVAIARELRVRCPRAALVAYCGGVRDTPARIGALAAAGVHQFVFTDVNDHGTVLRTILASARQQCAAEVVMAALRPLVPAPIHPLVEAALSRPSIVSDVRSLADALGVHRKTVFNRCAHAAVLNPMELLTWTRLALVAYLLEATGVTVEKISIETGYPSPTALRNTMKRYTGLRPMEVRASGGLQIVVDRLRARLGQNSAGLSAESARPTPLHTV
jgi:AraC-like DNA-binding protein